MKITYAMLFLIAIIFFPVMASAGMSRLSDTEMATVTGQAGVSIYVVDVQQDIFIAAITWGDTNFGSTRIMGQTVISSAGYVNVSNIKIAKYTITQSVNIQVPSSKPSSVQLSNNVTAPSGSASSPIVYPTGYKKSSRDDQVN
jgi:hypothetical protein